MKTKEEIALDIECVKKVPKDHFMTLPATYEDAFYCITIKTAGRYSYGKNSLTGRWFKLNEGKLYKYVTYSECNG